MTKKLIVLGCIFGLLSVVLGAFASHGLKPHIDADSLESFRTGVRYQMYHGLFLILSGLIPWLDERSRSVLFYSVLIGVILFSGSIYLLSTQDLSGIDLSPIGFVTPIGGLILIFSWIYLIYKVLRNPMATP